jgi:signal transduction histidine kinase
MLTLAPGSPPSLRRELTKTVAIGSIVWMLVVFLTMAFGVRHEVDDLMDEALREAAEVLYGSLVLHAPYASEYSGDMLPAPAHEENRVWQIVGPDLRVVLRSHRAPATPMRAPIRVGFDKGNGRWRVYAMALPQTGQMLLVGRSALENLEARYEAIAIVGASGLLASVVCALWMRRRVSQALQPLNLLSTQIQLYDPMRPETALAPPARQEFVEVHTAVTGLGSRFARRVEQEQAFGAHAAHALRTPLAGMDAQLAIAMRELPESALPRLARVREAVGRLTRVITSLLALFRSHAEPEIQPVWMSELMRHLTIDRLQVMVQQHEPLPADANLLAATLSNLLDNARRAGAHHCALEVQASGSAFWLELRDDGPGLPQQRIDRIMAATQQSREVADIGLGLKLAALVAHVHRGHRTITSAQPDGSGLAVRLSFLVTGAPPDGAIPRPSDARTDPMAGTPGMPSATPPENPVPQHGDSASS